MPAPPKPAASPRESGPRPARAWTFLFYVCEDHALVDPASATGSPTPRPPPARTSTWSCNRTVPEGPTDTSSTALPLPGHLGATAQLGSINTGSERTAVDFLSWGLEQCPSEHVAVIFAGIGIAEPGSVVGKPDTDPARLFAFCDDATSADALDAWELQTVFAQVLRSARRERHRPGPVRHGQPPVPRGGLPTRGPGRLPGRCRVALAQKGLALRPVAGPMAAGPQGGADGPWAGPGGRRGRRRPLPEARTPPSPPSTCAAAPRHPRLRHADPGPLAVTGRRGRLARPRAHRPAHPRIQRRAHRLRPRPVAPADRPFARRGGPSGGAPLARQAGEAAGRPRRDATRRPARGGPGQRQRGGPAGVRPGRAARVHRRGLPDPAGPARPGPPPGRPGRTGPGPPSAAQRAATPSSSLSPRPATAAACSSTGRASSTTFATPTTCASTSTTASTGPPCSAPST